LAIETSSPRLSLAVGTGDRVLKEYQGPLEWRHAETLFDGLQTLLKQVRWPVQSLTGVVVSIGPGSFTGIRIGMAAARALAQSLHIPIVGISSLETIARGALKPGLQACPILDALRGDVFTALYAMDHQGRVKTVWKECRMPAEELDRKMKARPQGSIRLIKEGFPRAGILLEAGRLRLERARNGSYEKVVPLYLRSAAAVERRKTG
jgi:tRNA threonylcarbamoyladenosine biosynthesis protein TsaB